MFPKTLEEEFKEPPMIHGKQRWQIILLQQEKQMEHGSSTNEGRDDLGAESSTQAVSKVEFTLADSTVELIGEPSNTDMALTERNREFDREGSSTRVVEVIYRKGVYLSESASLKDLRNAFIDSKQLDSKDHAFQFLCSDVPGDAFLIETENETLLHQIEHSLLDKRTVYIEVINPGE